MSGIEPVSEIGANVSPSMEWQLRRRPYADELSAVLGMDPAELARQLRNGASLVELAAGKGMSATKVIDALEALMVPNPNADGDFVIRVAHEKVVLRHRVRQPAGGTPADQSDRHPTPRRRSRVVLPHGGTGPDPATRARPAPEEAAHPSPALDKAKPVPPGEDATPRPAGSLDTYA